MANEKDKKTVTQADEQIKEAPKKKVPVYVPIIAVILAVLAIATAITVPLVLNGEYVNDYENPIAIIELSDGRKIEMEIWEEDCPVAATNFIYLARAKYFDGTVFYDASHGFVRFGGWKSDATHKGDSDTDYLNTITDRVTDSDNFTKNKFGYRLNKDSADKASGTDAMGIVSFGYKRSATEFQVAVGSGEEVDANLDGYADWTASAFAAIINSDDIEYLKDIYGLSKSQNYIPDSNYTEDYSTGLTFFAPQREGSLITIKTVTVKKLLKSKWKNFSFTDFYYNKAEDGTSSKNGSWSTYKKICGAT